MKNELGLGDDVKNSQLLFKRWEIEKSVSLISFFPLQDTKRQEALNRNGGKKERLKGWCLPEKGVFSENECRKLYLI